jgi:membrane protein implicated in regulation of membrane protease activity
MLAHGCALYGRVGTYRDPMLALTLEAAKNGAIVAVVVFAALAIASAWLMKTIAQKVALAVVLGLLAILVWTQRASLDDCAKRVRADRAASVTGEGRDTTCTFLGQDITIKSN